MEKITSSGLSSFTTILLVSPTTSPALTHSNFFPPPFLFSSTDSFAFSVSSPLSFSTFFLLHADPRLRIYPQADQCLVLICAKQTGVSVLFLAFGAFLFYIFSSADSSLLGIAKVAFVTIPLDV